MRNWADDYEACRITAQFWKMYDKAQYKQRWGNDKKIKRMVVKCKAIANKIAKDAIKKMEGLK